MLILIDLDGTIINTTHPAWKPYKDGQADSSIEPYLNQLPFFTGAREFLQKQKQQGNAILIVSDSHPAYVKPICKYLDCDCVFLAEKPNKERLMRYLDAHPSYKEQVESGDCFFIGDTALDIELGRKLGVPTIWILPYQVSNENKNSKDKVGDIMGAIKMGPTYAARTFSEVQQILDNPINNLYIIESLFAGGYSPRTIKYDTNRFQDHSFAAMRCLARQQSGVCDKYARADIYYFISNADRRKEIVPKLAEGVSSFLNLKTVSACNWDYLTYITDKRTTVPANKMKEIFDQIESPVRKVRLFKWADEVNKSLRTMKDYKAREAFLGQNLSIDTTALEREGLSLAGKNVVVIDDQLTTGATAWYVIRMLKKQSVQNVLFITLFLMVLPLESDVLCPRCGKPMSVKIRRADGHPFYSCNPPWIGGDGCGYTLNKDENNPLFRKYMEIIKNYESAFKVFIYGRQNIPQNMLQYDVNSEDTTHCRHATATVRHLSVRSGNRRSI